MQEQQRTINVGHYTFSRNNLLGKGSTGSVYLGQDTENGRQVACKVVEMSKVTHEVTKFLLENEKAALRMLHHPNILKCYDIYQQEQWCYIVTEYCNEGTLDNLIKTKGRLNEDDALDIFDGIVEGYKLCVEKKITHRDLKPANILMHNGQPKISDFGYCEVIGYPKPNSYYNVGSPCYMSPQALISSCYSEKSDVWSLGVILYEMLCGEPFDKPDEHMVITLKNIYDSGGVPFPKGISLYCKRLIRGCLEFDVHKRITVRKLMKLLQDNSDAEETSIIEKFDASPDREDLMRSNPLSIGNILRQFQPSRNGVYSFNSVPVAMRTMLERQLRLQQSMKLGVIASQNFQPRQPFVFQQLNQQNEKAKRHSRIRSLDVRARQISSAPIYKPLYQQPRPQEQPHMRPLQPIAQVQQVHHRHRPLTANNNAMLGSLQHNFMAQQYGKVMFKEITDQQIPNIRYMNPIFSNPLEGASDYQRSGSVRSLSIQSNTFKNWGTTENTIPLHSPPQMTQTYQPPQSHVPQRFGSNGAIEESQNIGVQPQDIYGLRTNEAQKKKPTLRPQIIRSSTNIHHKNQQPSQQDLLASEYFYAMPVESKARPHPRPAEDQQIY